MLRLIIPIEDIYSGRHYPNPNKAGDTLKDPDLKPYVEFAGGFQQRYEIEEKIFNAFQRDYSTDVALKGYTKYLNFMGKTVGITKAFLEIYKGDIANAAITLATTFIERLWILGILESTEIDRSSFKESVNFSDRLSSERLSTAPYDKGNNACLDFETWVEKNSSDLPQDNTLEW